MSEYTESSVPEQTGKTFFITGANTGIGYEAARVLAGRGARVLLGCRSEDKATGAMAEIRGLHPTADLAWIPLDLTSLKSVETAAQIVKKEPRLDGHPRTRRRGEEIQQMTRERKVPEMVHAELQLEAVHWRWDRRRSRRPA